MLLDFSFSFTHLDDIIGIVSESLGEHTLNINSLLDRTDDHGFTLKFTKCEFYLSQIKYLGLMLYKHNRKPDPEKIKAVTCIPPAINVCLIQSFFDMNNYYSCFLKLHELRRPSNVLLRKNQSWN
ncbi:unnamed protein product [Heterobilharzia americana]|nr:unnamed protein product [Heterobilharzia americana]